MDEDEVEPHRELVEQDGERLHTNKDEPGNTLNTQVCRDKGGCLGLERKRLVKTACDSL